MVAAPKLPDIPEYLIANMEKAENLQLEQELITSVRCGKRYSAILTNKGRLLMCGNHK